MRLERFLPFHPLLECYGKLKGLFRFFGLVTKFFLYFFCCSCAGGTYLAPKLSLFRPSHIVLPIYFYFRRANTGRGILRVVDILKRNDVGLGCDFLFSGSILYTNLTSPALRFHNVVCETLSRNCFLAAPPNDK